MNRLDALQKIATRLRISSLMMTTNAGSGHPTTCLSMAEIAACLFFGEMRFNPEDPEDWGNDELVLSKGHAAPDFMGGAGRGGDHSPQGSDGAAEDHDGSGRPSDPPDAVGQDGDGLAWGRAFRSGRAWPRR